MLNKVFKAVSNGEIIKVIEFDDKTKQCIVELEDGRTKAYSSATLKDKRRFIPAETDDEPVEKIIGKETADLLKETIRDIKAAPVEKKTTLVEDFMEAGLISPKKEASGTKARISITYRGETKTPFEWGRLLGLDPKYIREQLRKGKTPEEIFKEKK